MSTSLKQTATSDTDTSSPSTSYNTSIAAMRNGKQMLGKWHQEMTEYRTLLAETLNKDTSTGTCKGGIAL